VRDVVGHPSHTGRIEAGQGRAEEERRAAGVERPQALPLGGGDVAVGLHGEIGVVGVRHGIQLGRRHARVLEAPGHGLLGQLPGGEGHGRLAVLPPREALLLGGRDGLAVDDERGGRVMEYGVDTENTSHRPLRSPRSASNETTRVI
jgi:hypothetical protein